MTLKNKKYYYFIGIGGIGMSALARYVKKTGHVVAGYDRTATPLTEQLRREGIKVFYSQKIDELPQIFLNPRKVVVVYTPAIAPDNELLLYFKNMHFQIYKRADILGKISEQTQTIAIAGTHGKTSITAITAHLMQHHPQPNVALVGGILKNYDSNFIISKQQLPENPFFTVEADEYDRSFLTLQPQIALISSIEHDHSDIYRNQQDIQRAFIQFAQNTKHKLIRNIDIPFQDQYIDLKPYTYGLKPQADYYADNIQVVNGSYIFDFHSPNLPTKQISLPLPGKLNLENAIGAMALVLQTGMGLDTIANAIASFQGVKRRFDMRFRNNHCIYIDDYAHHPTEIEYFVRSVKEMFPNKEITGIFQPHLFSRTKDFYQEFGHELSKLNQVFLLDIYPAREKPIHGITSNLIFNHITHSNKFLLSKDEVLTKIKQQQHQIIVTIGAGDIGLMVPDIELILKEKYN